MAGEALDAGQAAELVTTFDVVPQPILIFEGAEAEVAGEVVTGRSLVVHFKCCLVLEDSPAERAMIVVIGKLLAMCSVLAFAIKLEIADAAQVFRFLERLVVFV